MFYNVNTSKIINLIKARVLSVVQVQELERLVIILSVERQSAGTSLSQLKCQMMMMRFGEGGRGPWAKRGRRRVRGKVMWNQRGRRVSTEGVDGSSIEKAAKDDSKDIGKSIIVRPNNIESMDLHDEHL